MQQETLWKFEQCKLFMNTDIQKLEDEFNLWYRQETGKRKKIPVLQETPVKILDRDLCVRVYEDEETFVLAIFYEHYDVNVAAQGPDRGQGKQGASAFGPK